MKSYSVHIPGQFYALTVDARSEREARAKARKNLGYSRLPAGVAVWQYTSLPVPGPLDAARYQM